MDKFTAYVYVFLQVIFVTSARRCPADRLKILAYKGDTADWFKVKAIPESSSIQRALSSYPWDAPGEHAYRGKRNNDQKFVIESKTGQPFGVKLARIFVKFSDRVEFQAILKDGSKSPIIVRPNPAETWNTDDYNSANFKLKKLVQRIEITVFKLKDVERLKSKVRVRGLNIRACAQASP